MNLEQVKIKATENLKALAEELKIDFSKPGVVRTPRHPHILGYELTGHSTLIFVTDPIGSVFNNTRNWERVKDDRCKAYTKFYFVNGSLGIEAMVQEVKGIENCHSITRTLGFDPKSFDQFSGYFTGEGQYFLSKREVLGINDRFEVRGFYGDNGLTSVNIDVANSHWEKYPTIGANREDGVLVLDLWDPQLHKDKVISYPDRIPEVDGMFRIQVGLNGKTYLQHLPSTFNPLEEVERMHHYLVNGV